ncbi:MAG: PEP-utilizing enzyme, partial [Gaiellaceae bacterium]
MSAFPSPYEIETPPGCEGWEEMYPYYAVFDEARRAEDENRFWFWNSMHFPVPMPSFDVQCIDAPYQAVGEWQNRFFAVPPAMGIDYRIVNGYVYISGNPVTDPAKIAERVEYFQRRAGYYFEHWEELYAVWKRKMEALIAEITNLPVPELPEYEPDALMEEDDRDTTVVDVLTAYSRTLRCGDLMWQHHFELLLLGYGAYVTFSDFCKTALPDIPEQHIAQMVAGIDVLLFKPSAELLRLAKLAISSGVDSAFAEGRSPEEIDAELGESEAGRSWLEELERTKDPWFNMATGDGLYHYYRSWYDDPSIPYASIAGYIRALADGDLVERPTEEVERERDRLADEY